MALKEQKEIENQKRIEEASKNFDEGDLDEDSEEKDFEEQPSGIIQPKYKIVHTFPTEMFDAWGGYTTSQMDHDAEMKKRVPSHLTVTLNLKWIDSIKEANLDINETTLLFEYPEIYYLDLNLKYQVDKDAGNAKFDKKKKTLTIKLPIVGLTEDSKKVMEEHYQKTVVDQQERFKVL